MEAQKSQIVISKAGHDKGQLFFVLDADERCVTLADGSSRKLEKPKRKNIKHVRFVSESDPVIARKIREDETLLNSELRKALAVFGKRQDLNKEVE